MARAQAVEVPLCVLTFDCKHPKQANDGGEVMGGGCGRYADWSDGSANFETFLMKELLPMVQTQFNAGSDDPSKMAVSGISSAGLGALRMGMRNPHVFGLVCALEAPITPSASAAQLNLQHPQVPFSFANEKVVFSKDGVLCEEHFHATGGDEQNCCT